MKTQTELLHRATAVKRELAERDLSSYIQQAWPVIEPDTTYLHNWHIDLIAEYLEAVTAGEIKRLIINIPPRYGKSNLVTVMWPTWEWIRQPGNRYIFSSYSESLSTKHSVDRRTIIQSRWYQDNWRERYQLTTDQNVKTEYVNNKRGHMIATSIGGTATGKGGNRLIIDDPHNPTQALSDVQREAGVRFVNQTLMTRLDNKKTDPIIIVMHRLHENDLTGVKLADKSWVHVCIPAEAPNKTVIVFPRSRRLLVRPSGDVLWPEREGTRELEALKHPAGLGAYGYAGQYQQSPSPAEGGILQRDWWRFYRQAPAGLERMIQSWDCAFKNLKTSDFVVGQVWGQLGANKYLLDQVRGQMTFLATLTAVRALSAKWPEARGKLVEDKANGTAVIQTLKNEIPGLIAVEPEGGKIARAQAVSWDIEAGNVYLPDPSVCPWVGDFIEECAAFPNAAHDDQVDAMSQALIRLGSRRSYAGVSLAANAELARSSPNRI